MALITWGCRLEFSYVDEEEIREFIKTKGKTIKPWNQNISLLQRISLAGLNGPEGTHPKDGQYEYGLITSSAKLHGVAPDNMNENKADLCSKWIQKSCTK